MACDSKKCLSRIYVRGGRYICDHNNLKVNFPDLVNEWNEENGPMEGYSANSNKKVSWVCSKNKYHKNWESKITGRTTNLSGCPSCYKDKRSKSNLSVSLSTLYPELCEEWNYEKNGNLHPDDVFSKSGKRIWWKCVVCSHEWTALICQRTMKNSGCPFCANKKLCIEESCDTCFNKSFASHERSEFWSNENTVTSRSVFRSAIKKYKFNCPDCDDLYEMSPNAITHGNWCGCKNYKTENKLLEHLKLCSTDVEKQKMFDFCKKQIRLRFDFFIGHLNVIIELDGMQHFCQVSNWKLPKETQDNDIYKMRCVNDKGYSVIRLLQENVWEDKNDWQTHLFESLESIYFLEESYKNIFITNDGPVDTFEIYCENYAR